MIFEEPRQIRRDGDPENAGVNCRNLIDMSACVLALRLRWQICLDADVVYPLTTWWSQSCSGLFQVAGGRLSTNGGSTKHKFAGMFDGTSLLAAWFCAARNITNAAFTGLFSLRRLYLLSSGTRIAFGQKNCYGLVWVRVTLEFSVAV